MAFVSDHEKASPWMTPSIIAHYSRLTRYHGCDTRTCTYWAMARKRSWGTDASRYCTASEGEKKKGRMSFLRTFTAPSPTLTRTILPKTGVFSSGTSSLLTPACTSVRSTPNLSWVDTSRFESLVILFYMIHSIKLTFLLYYPDFFL